MIAAIVAMDDERAIGRNGTLPWKIPEDMKRFRKLTTGATVVMGRKTYDSLPDRFRPLPDRKNVVISRSPRPAAIPKEVEWYESMEKLLAMIRDVPRDQKVWIIGGAEIYNLTLPQWDRVYLSAVYGTHGGDTFLPVFEHDFKLLAQESFDNHAFRVYERVRR